MFYRTPFRPRAVTVSVSRVWTPISRTDNLDFVPTRRNSVRCCRQTRYQGVLSIAFLLNLFMVIYFFFTNGCLCIFFILPIAVCFLNAHCFLFYSHPPWYQKNYISVKLFVWKMSFILITLGLIWFIFGLYTFFRVFVGYTLTFNKVSRSRL